jgi:hypothetical protein
LFWSKKNGCVRTRQPITKSSREAGPIRRYLAILACISLKLLVPFACPKVSQANEHGSGVSCAKTPEVHLIEARQSAQQLIPVAVCDAGAVRDTLREHGEPIVADPGQVTTFMQARTAHEVLKAQERRVRLQRMKGELVDRARAVAQVFKLARAERDAWVNWPARAPPPLYSYCVRATTTAS